MAEINEKYIKIDTPNTTLLYEIKHAHTNPLWDNNQFRVFLEPVYYGKKLMTDKNFEILHTKTHTFNTSVSCFGNFDHRSPLILLENSDGSLVSDFSFEEARILPPQTLEGLPFAHNGKETIEFIYKDSLRDLQLINSITVFSDSDVIASCYRLENLSSSTVQINRLMSLQLDLFGTQYTMISFDGWWGRERARNERKLGIGVSITESICGVSSHAHNPFFILKDDRWGNYYAFNLIYSGNHKESVEISPYNAARILVGMNDMSFSYALKPKETFQTPQAIFVYAESEAQLTTQMHNFVRRHIVKEQHTNSRRPIVVNNWEATYFNFTRDKILSIAQAGANLGAELFVLDDGWFSTRDNACSGLGDWTDNTTKTGGLAELALQIRAMGLKFGIWIEPEMVNPKSNLYMQHPEYASLIPGRDPMVHRSQYLLDLTNSKVVDFLTDAVSHVIDLCSADYVKWDFNRTMTEFYSPQLENQGEFNYRYMLGLYTLLDRITKKYPNVLFESCAGGGGRFDLGMLYYMPQIWTSDNTDARMRIPIQEGTAYGYPQNTMTAHISKCPNYMTQNSTSIEDAFNIAVLCNLGYEFDLSSLKGKAKKAVKEQILWYKKHRNTLQNGNYFLLESINNNPEQTFGWIVVSEDKAQAVAMIGSSEFRGCGLVKFRFQGLSDNAIYKITERKQINQKNSLSFVASGRLLNSGPLDFGAMDSANDRSKNSNSVYTKLFSIEKIS